MERDRDAYAESGVYAPSDLSPYSTSSTYSSESHTYYPELDWPGQQEARALYGLSDKTDIHHQVHLYPGYPPHPDLYHPHHGLWHHHHDEGVNPSVATLPPLTTTIGLSRSASAGSSSAGANGKPKRRRVQNASQRKAANIRERKRMFHLNEAFDELRKRLPAFNYEKRLSRIETLRLAITYISFMKDVTDGEDPRNVKLKSYPDENSHHMSLGGVGGSDDLNSDSNDDC